MKTLYKIRKLIAFIGLLVYCTNIVAPLFTYAATNTAFIQNVDNALNVYSGLNTTLTGIESSESDSVSIIYVGSLTASKVSIQKDATSYDGSAMTYLITIPDPNMEAHFLQTPQGIYAVSYIDPEGNAHVIEPTYDADGLWTGNYSIDTSDRSEFAQVDNRNFNTYDSTLWETDDEAAELSHYNNESLIPPGVYGASIGYSIPGTMVYVGDSVPADKDAATKVYKDQNKKLIAFTKADANKMKYNDPVTSSKQQYTLDGVTVTVDVYTVPSKAQIWVENKQTIVFWPDEATADKKFIYWIPSVKAGKKSVPSDIAAILLNNTYLATAKAAPESDCMSLDTYVGLFPDAEASKSNDSKGAASDDANIKFLNGMSAAALGKEDKVGSNSEDLGNTITTKYSEIKNDVGDVKSWSKWKDYGKSKGVTETSLKQGILLQKSMFKDGNSLLTSDIGDDYYSLLKSALGTKGDDISVTAGDQDTIEKIWKDNKENNTISDYAATTYGRISYLTQWAANPEFNSNYTYTDISPWLKNSNKVFGSTYKILGSDPIMLDDNYFSKSLIKDNDDSSKGGIYAVPHLNRAIGEWGYYATTWRESIKDDINGTNKAILKNMEKTVSDYKSYYPALATAWEYGSPSLKDLYEKGSEGGDDDTGTTDTASSIDHPQPLLNFFEIKTLGQNVTGLNDPWKWFSEDSAAHAAPITFSDYLLEGITYSAGYVPLMTNVYTKDVILNQDDTFNKEFHYKYGFMRKALYIDTNATSVQTYYNTHGRTTASKRICTLKDLLEHAENNQEVLLSLDDNFYNMDQVEEATDKYITAQHERLEKAYGAATSMHNESMKDDSSTTGGENDETSEEGGAPGEVNQTTNWFEKVLDTIVGVFGWSATGQLAKLVESLTGRINSTPQYSDIMLKNGDYTQYNASLRNDLNYIDMDFLMGGNYVDTDEDTLGKNNSDNWVLTSYDIKQILSGLTTREEVSSEDETIGYRYTTYNPYSPALSYAFVSAIYRDKAAFSFLQDCSNYSPVFMASEQLAANASKDDEITPILQNTIYNWALLKNLESQSQITYSYALDMDSPLYIDIYGNILTASGTVVIPAAANATLWNSDWAEKQPAIGLYACYGQEYHIPSTVDTKQLGYKWALEDSGKYWMPMSRVLSMGGVDSTIDFANLNAYDENAKELAITYMQDYLLDADAPNWWAYTGIIHEVMRGAPIENIDTVKENLNNNNEDADGIILASKLEGLEESLNNSQKQNSLFTIPDFTRVEHVEYILAFFIKIMAILTVMVVIILVYRDGAAGEIGPRTFGKTIWAVFLTFTSITMIPTIFQFSYYGANKLLLQREASRIAMFTTEKYQSGIEVGVTSTSVPTNTNDLMIQLDWVNIPWYDYLQEMIFGNSLGSMTLLRDKAYERSAVAKQPDVRMYNDGVYMSVTDIMNSVTIDYSYGSSLYSADTTSDNSIGDDIGSAEDKNLYMRAESDQQTLSFYSPYYVFLRAITKNINQYNYDTDTYRYVTRYMSGARPKTVGLCATYFQSPHFMEDTGDIFHLYEVFGQSPETERDLPEEIFSATDIEQMSKSKWYVNPMNIYDTDKRIDNMNEYARSFIANNKDMLNKVTDETFIKIFCLDCALHFNQLYGVSEASAYEIYNMDANDLLRLAICKSDDAMLATPMSYARYVFTYGGEAGVYAAAVLLMIVWLGSILKPLCTILVFLAVFISIFVNKVMLRQRGGFTGYVITGLLLCATNVLHAVLLKLSTYLPDFGFPTFICILMIAGIQVIYLLILGYMTAFAVREWQDAGLTKYQAAAQQARAHRRGHMADQLNADIPYHKDNREYYNDLVNTYRRRHGGEKVDL